LRGRKAAHLGICGHGAVGPGVGLVAELEGHAARAPLLELLVVHDARHGLHALLVGQKGRRMSHGDDACYPLPRLRPSAAQSCWRASELKWCGARTHMVVPVDDILAVVITLLVQPPQARVSKKGRCSTQQDHTLPSQYPPPSTSGAS
jgi:hypothetical protein